MSSQQFTIYWTPFATEDLRGIYRFNQDAFSQDYAIKIFHQLIEAPEELIFSNQWQRDIILNSQKKTNYLWTL